MKASKGAIKRAEELYEPFLRKSNGNVALNLKASEIHLVLHGNSDKDNLLDMLKDVDLEYPLDVLIKKSSKKRSLAQNRTQWQWFRDAEAQGDQKAWEYRAFCKLHFGVPILRRDSLAYREKYDSLIKPLFYEQKLELMTEGAFDMEVTSLMNVSQHSEFLDMVRVHFTGLGMQLTDPQEWE